LAGKHNRGVLVIGKRIRFTTPTKAGAIFIYEIIKNNIMTEKQLSPHDANKFFDLLAKRHPEIDVQLPSKNLVDNSIVCFKPAKMKDDEYDIYVRFLKRWYMENGFIPFEPDLVYVFTNDQKAMAIDTSSIISINRVDMEFTKVEIKEKDSEMTSTIVIKEEKDQFKNRVYIY